MQQLQEFLVPAMAQLCTSMLELDVFEDFASSVSADSVEFVGCVHLAGAPPGAVVIECTEAFARSVASTMFATAPEYVSESDIRDAVGEFANVAAGNLKAVLSEPYLLSLPTVVEGNDFRTHLPRGKTVAHTAFVTPVGRFAVSVFEQNQTLRTLAHS